MMPPDNAPPGMTDSLIAGIHASPFRAVLAITGGGSSAIGRLLGVPGASSTIIEAVVPYAASSLREWLGGDPDQACSERTARAMAMKSFERGQGLLACDPEDPHTLVGIGCTASLVSDRPKRGEHRLHVAAQTSQQTLVVSLTLEKGRRSRAEEEAIASQAVIATLADAAGVRPIDFSKTPPGIEASLDRFEAPVEWTELLLGERENVLIESLRLESPVCLFPGSFNPQHSGHREMANYARSKTGQLVVYELSILNVDKPPLDFIELRNRVEGLSGESVLLTRSPTFVEKANLVPGCLFVVGVDTIERIGDVRYYAGDSKRRDTALAKIKEQGCRFLVFGRQVDGVFRSVDEVTMPTELRSLCGSVSEKEFRVDASSTQLREA